MAEAVARKGGWPVTASIFLLAFNLLAVLYANIARDLVGQTLSANPRRLNDFLGVSVGTIVTSIGVYMGLAGAGVLFVASVILAVLARRRVGLLLRSGNVALSTIALAMLWWAAREMLSHAD